MYHAIVKRIALKNFLRVNRKDYTPILKGCSPDIHHRFGGHHALGGERHDREALRRWFERLGRLAPTLRLATFRRRTVGGDNRETATAWRVAPQHLERITGSQNLGNDVLVVLLAGETVSLTSGLLDYRVPSLQRASQALEIPSG
jgi:hypothetical protein